MTVWKNYRLFLYDVVSGVYICLIFVIIKLKIIIGVKRTMPTISMFQGILN